MEELIEKYTRTTRKPKKTASKLKLVARYIDDITGRATRLNEISKSVLITLQTEALSLPARPTRSEKAKSFVELSTSLKEACPDRPLLSPQAVRSWFNLLSGCFNWAVSADLMEHNPTHGIKPRLGRSEGVQRLPFTTADLRRIFDPEIYPAKSEHSKYWLPILGLLTGARLNELGQLYVKDIHILEGAQINITDRNCLDGHPKRLKNSTSNRIIPIHPILVELGFLDFVKSKRAVYLFDDLHHHGSYEPTKPFSQWFGRYLRRTGILEKQKVFHSFRHTFKDECRRNGIEEEVHDALTGHGSKARQIGRSYGAGVPFEILDRAVASLYKDRGILTR